MAIVGDNPDHGARVLLERPAIGGPPWIYSGSVALADKTFAVNVRVAADGGVVVDGEIDRALAERARLIVRAAAKNALEAGQPPPRRIHRWRDEK